MFLVNYTLIPPWSDPYLPVERIAQLGTLSTQVGYIHQTE